MSEKKEREVGWEPCPKGEIGRMLEVIQRNRRRAALVQTAVAVAGAVLIAAVIVRSVPTHRAATRSGEMTCAEVLAYAPAYLSGRLDPQLRAKVEDHLRKCPGCRKKVEQMKGTRTSQRRGARQRTKRRAIVTPRLARNGADFLSGDRRESAG
ncbi:MAG: hypothetical protein GXP27_05800 [Planctomycetes bacterium]|nr:hypothetical protein [Planctomycetota bacterium]